MAMETPGQGDPYGDGGGSPKPRPVDGHRPTEINVAPAIVTGGEVDADIKARDSIELYAPSRVTGALHAPAIFIDRGVKFEGSCKMAPLDEDEDTVAQVTP